MSVWVVLRCVLHVQSTNVLHVSLETFSMLVHAMLHVPQLLPTLTVFTAGTV